MSYDMQFGCQKRTHYFSNAIEKSRYTVKMFHSGAFATLRTTVIFQRRLQKVKIVFVPKNSCRMIFFEHYSRVVALQNWRWVTVYSATVLVIFLTYTRDCMYHSKPWAVTCVTYTHLKYAQKPTIVVVWTYCNHVFFFGCNVYKHFQTTHNQLSL